MSTFCLCYQLLFLFKSESWQNRGGRGESLSSLSSGIHLMSYNCNEPSFSAYSGADYSWKVTTFKSIGCGLTECRLKQVDVIIN